jgi:hypothetical protein
MVFASTWRSLFTHDARCIVLRSLLLSPLAIVSFVEWWLRPVEVASFQAMVTSLPVAVTSLPHCCGSCVPRQLSLCPWQWLPYNVVVSSLFHGGRFSTCWLFSPCDFFAKFDLSAVGNFSAPRDSLAPRDFFAPRNSIHSSDFFPPCNFIASRDWFPPHDIFAPRDNYAPYNFFAKC